MPKYFSYKLTNKRTYEPWHEKTSLWGFHPCATQIGKCSHRSRLEAWNFGYKWMIYCTIRVPKTKALISCAVTAQLICAFVFAYAKIQFSHVAAHKHWYWTKHVIKKINQKVIIQCMFWEKILEIIKIFQWNSEKISVYCMGKSVYCMGKFL